MSYGAISASSSTSSSLLIPTNPAFTSSESSHKGGILVNVSRVSDDPPRTSTSSNEDGGHRPMLDPDSPITPVTPLSPTSAIPDPPSSILSPPLSMHSSSAYTASTATPRIRFAPLPDPRRPRSMSTGRNVVWKATMEPNGELTRTIAIKANEPTEYADDDVALEDEDEGGEGDGKRGKNWGKTMSGSWKGTKKLLGYSASREKEDAGYSEGAPLKKSVSTGGFIGAWVVLSLEQASLTRSDDM